MVVSPFAMEFDDPPDREAASFLPAMAPRKFEEFRDLRGPDA